jgi:hypothetical protein
MILRGEPDIVTVRQKRRLSERGRGVALITEPEEKMYRISFHKRRRLNDNTSVPFGYINEAVGDTVI